MMRYEKPVVELVSFQTEEKIMTETTTYPVTFGDTGIKGYVALMSINAIEAM